MSDPDQPGDTETSGINRRDLLKRGAVVGAAAAWTVPVLQIVSMTSAHADSPSSPGGGGGGQPVVPNQPGAPIDTTVPVTTLPTESTAPAPVASVPKPAAPVHTAASSSTGTAVSQTREVHDAQGSAVTGLANTGGGEFMAPPLGNGRRLAT